MNPIGIMQGRLSPPVDGRIQSFPLNWSDEFPRAGEAGLYCIEWIYDAETSTVNPIATDEGIKTIRQLTEQYAVHVLSICADYFMTERIVDSEGRINSSTLDRLKWLLERANLLGVRYIVLPFVDSSSLKSTKELQGLIKAIQSAIPNAVRSKVEIHLETDLASPVLRELLGKVSHPLVRMNYDIGNSASLGYDPLEELTSLGPLLGSVHVKDRLLGGSTVRLGTGSADFKTCFRLIRTNGFQGPFILQAARETGLTETELAIRNRNFVMQFLM
jgi:hexulose-6-phosphate isomerase